MGSVLTTRWPLTMTTNTLTEDTPQRAKCKIFSELSEELLRYLMLYLWRLLTSLLPVSVFTLSWCLCCDIYRPSPWHHDHLHDSLLVVAVTGVMATLSPVECGHFSHQVASRTPTNQRPVRVDSDQWEGDSGSGDVGAGPRDTPAPLPRPRTVKLR